MSIVNNNMQLGEFVISGESSKLEVRHMTQEAWSSAKVQKGWWLLIWSIHYFLSPSSQRFRTVYLTRAHTHTHKNVGSRLRLMIWRPWAQKPQFCSFMGFLPWLWSWLSWNSCHLPAFGLKREHRRWDCWTNESSSQRRPDRRYQLSASSPVLVSNLVGQRREECTRKKLKEDALPPVVVEWALPSASPGVHLHLRMTTF